jgi:hypothetical protein|tara:strand:- start:1233 stop:1397 length:165 start_codon:yes stop_codon:yes gene_type:complete
MQILGGLLIAFGVIDFLAGNFGNTNLTAFMGPLSSFSPIIFIVVGGLLTQVGEK